MIPRAELIERLEKVRGILANENVADLGAYDNAFSELLDKLLPDILDVLREDGWRPIDEHTPRNTDVLLGWWDIWPERRWRYEVGWVGCRNSMPAGSPYSNAWEHGHATHFKSLPFPPDGAARDRHP